MLRRGCYLVPVSYDNFDISLLGKFDYGIKIKLNTINKIEDIKELVKNYDLQALVSTQSLKNFEEINTDIPVLRPLIAYTGEQIKERLNEFRRVC